MLHGSARRGSSVVSIGSCIVAVLALAGAVMLPEARACPPEDDADSLFSPRYGQLMEWSTKPPSRPRPPLNPGPASAVGQWEAPVDWPVIPIHSAMLPTGKVLQYAYPSGGATLWDPIANEFQDAMYKTDLFCSGHSFLSDGMLYVTGGNRTDCEFQGRVETNVFNPYTEEWVRLDDMEDGRWYPTNVELADGRTVIFAGYGLDCEHNGLIELFTPGEGLEVIGSHVNPLYPSMHLLSDGRIVRIGPSAQTMAYTVETDDWEEIDLTNFARSRVAGTSVRLPGRTDEFMIIGGGNDGFVTAMCEIIDFKEAEPQWRATGSLHHARKHINPVILPDKSIFLVGGGLNNQYDDPTFVPEMFDVETETWTELPQYVYQRMYHSTALLLPDGRVLVAGQDNGESAHKAEIYLPPYLFRGERPAITMLPDTVVYDRTFTIECDRADEIVSVCLLSPAAVTHSVNMNQRYVELPFVNLGEGVLEVEAPRDGYEAPPGPYMCFVRTADDVPSVAAWIRVVQAAAAPITFLQMQTGTVLSGDLPELQVSDDAVLQTRSGFGRSFTDLHHMEFQVTAEADVYAPRFMDIRVEHRISDPAGTAQVRVRNLATGNFDLVATASVGSTESTILVQDLPAADYWNEHVGRTRLRLRHIVFVPFFAYTFDSFVDQISVELK